MIAKQQVIETIESRWKDYSKERPRIGEVFVGMNNNTVYNTLFVKIGVYDVAYLKDMSTHISSEHDFFTHWLFVGEVKE